MYALLCFGNTKRLTSLKFEWQNGFKGYKQGVKKGHGNYKHVERTDKGGLYFNGYGGVSGFQQSLLTVFGKDKDGNSFSCDIRTPLLELLGRKKITEKLMENIENNFPSRVTLLFNDDGESRFDTASSEQIKKDLL